MSDAKWETYEQVAAFLLNEIAEQFGLERVTGKTKVRGQATSWQVDAIGWHADNRTFVVIECKRRGRRSSQDVLGNLYYVIRDIGASGGIIVTASGLQKGALDIASKHGYTVVHLDREATTTDHVLQFLNQVRIGRSVNLNPLVPSQSVSVEARGPGDV